MIVVTGAAGFIGSCLVTRLNEKGYFDLVLADDFSRNDKEPNLNGKKFLEKINRDKFPEWLEKNGREVKFVFHIGARTDTTEQNEAIFQKLNLDYSKKIWNICTANSIPLVYASSAATYGNGEFGYHDDESNLFQLQPLNPYGWSKHKFDLWVKEQKSTPPHWYGLKFFNVYGPNENHKRRMASVIFHAYYQIKEKGKVKLFRSHRDDYKDGWQLRDFIYVKDLISVCIFMMENQPASGIYNLGTGKARSFYDLALAVFQSVNKNPDIEFIDIPQDIRDAYQYFTEADMNKLRSNGYALPFYSLEDGVSDYVKNYLSKESRY